MTSTRKSPPASRKDGELALIQHIRSRAGRPHGELRLGIGDDCAILRVRPGEELLVTTDFSLEGRHFRRDWHPSRSVGHRALARGLSDIAAMGARPVAAFLSLALPPDVARNKHWVNGFFDGLLSLAAVQGVPLAGGDTAQSPGDAVLADIVLLGAAPAGRALRRSGARPGDLLYVTGALGGAVAELFSLGAAPASYQRARPDGTHPHLFPGPRLAAGRELLRRKLATACIDLSDGISTDLRHLCEASGVGAELEAAALPVHALAAALPEPERTRCVLHGGEDYELLFTAPPTVKMPKSLRGLPLTRIGRIVKGNRVTLLAADRTRSELAAGGWEHFRS